LPFLHQVSFLKEKLGPILFQFPPSLAYAPVHVRRFLTSLREIVRGDVVWEPRHPSWFTAEVDLLLQEFGIARVAADPACVPSAALPGGWPSLIYFRLHGSPRLYYSAYSNDFLDALATDIASRAPQSRVWCIFDNTAAAHAIPNAAALRDRLDIIQPQQFMPITQVIPAL
jgi:uncharacterized protein YecE (DUF72 family)